MSLFETATNLKSKFHQLTFEGAGIIKRHVNSKKFPLTWATVNKVHYLSGIEADIWKISEDLEDLVSGFRYRYVPAWNDMTQYQLEAQIGRASCRERV